MDLNNILNPIVTPPTKCTFYLCTNIVKKQNLCLKHYKLYNYSSFKNQTTLEGLKHISKCRNCTNPLCRSTYTLISRMRTNLKNKYLFYFHEWSVVILIKHKENCSNNKCNVCTYFEDYI